MKFKSIAVATLLLVGVLSPIFAGASSCDAKTKECAKKTKTPSGQAVYPVAVWEAEAVDANGNIIDECVAIWETSDGSMWVAKRVQPADASHKKSIKTPDGQIMAPMTHHQAKKATVNNQKEVNMVKCGKVCDKKDVKSCNVSEYTRSMDGKKTVVSDLDKKTAKKSTPTPVSDSVSTDEAFIVISE